MSCLQEAVNAQVIYSNTYPRLQYVYGIQYINPKSGSWLEGHKDWPACYIGITIDARTTSRTHVYSLNNSGPFYEWWEWSKLLKQRGLITNFQAVIDRVWSTAEDKSLPDEKVRDLKDVWVQLQIASDKYDAIRRLKAKEGHSGVYQEVLEMLENPEN